MKLGEEIFEHRIVVVSIKKEVIIGPRLYARKWNQVGLGSHHSSKPKATTTEQDVHSSWSYGGGGVEGSDLVVNKKLSHPNSTTNKAKDISLGRSAGYHCVPVNQVEDREEHNRSGSGASQEQKDVVGNRRDMNTMQYQRIKP